MAAMAWLSGDHLVWLVAGLLVLCSEGSPLASHPYAHASERSHWSHRDQRYSYLSAIPAGVGGSITSRILFLL